MMDESIPICTSCGHRHVLGIKCLICGHVGKSQIYSKMLLKANEKRSFHIVIIDGWNDPRFKLINEVKNSILSDELDIMKAFGKELDNSSTHMLVTVGDNPAGVGRIRVELDHSAVVVVVLDHFAILPCYRRRGLLKQCFLRIISDIIAYNNNTAHRISSSSSLSSSSQHTATNSSYYLRGGVEGSADLTLPITRLAFIVPALSAWLSQLLLSVFGPILRVIQLQQLPQEVYRLEIPIDGQSIGAIQSVLGCINNKR